MKDKWIALLALILVLSVCSCSRTDKGSRVDDDSNGRTGSKVENETDGSEENDVEIIYPEESQIQYICNLATMECYYHNVARGTVAAGTGVPHWGEEDTVFWVEYDATVTLGIDASRISMDMRDGIIYIYMPPVTILGGVDIDPDSISDPVYPPHRAFTNDVDISSEDVYAAMSNAEEIISNQIMGDPVLLNSAHEQAVNIIQGYIDQLEELSGVHYEVHFTTIG